MTDTTNTKTATCLNIAINRQDPTTNRIEAAYTFRMAWMVIKDKARSPVGWAGILENLIEWGILKNPHAGIPAGPFVPPAQPTDAPVISNGATKHQIAAIERTWSFRKNLWKEYCDAEEGRKSTWIEACSEDVI